MNRDLTTGRPWNVLWVYILPILGSVVFQQLYNMADSIVAGHFVSENALAAVGNTASITLIYIAFAVGCNAGCSVIVSQFFGAKRFLDLKSAVRTMCISFGVLCAALMVFGFCFTGNLLDMINTPAVIRRDCLIYLLVYTGGMPFIFFYNIANGIFSAMGDSRTPFFFLAFSSVANILMDILFTAVFGWGVPGLAIATLVCQGISCVWAWVVLGKRLAGMETTEKPEWFASDLFKKMLVVALPSIAQQVFICVANIIIQGMVNPFGEGVIAGFTSALRLNMLTLSCLMAASNGLSAFVAQNVGAGKYDRIRQGMKAAIGMGCLFAIPFIFLYEFGGAFCIRLFMESDATQDAIRMGVWMLKDLSPFYIAICIKIVVDGAFRGVGSMIPFMISTMADLFLRVVLVAVLTGMFAERGVGMAWGASWVLGMLLSVILFKSGIWKRSLHFLVKEGE